MISITGIIAFPALATASSGGIGLTPTPDTSAPKRATLLANGQAVAPDNAPGAVVGAIKAANRIAKKRYCWGGGHKSFKKAKCYDCSGAVSYVLRGARIIKKPRTSVTLKSWGRRGQGRWITVYTNNQHAYIVVAGLRFDTANTGRNGPRWSKSLRSTRGKFAARHYSGL